MKIVYLDCFSGISGDMTLAALVDAGADRDYVERELAKIRIEPFTLDWKRVNKRGISSLKMDVLLDPSRLPQHHRHYSDIVRMIEGAGFSERTKSYSLAIFEKIGIAEGKIHGIPLDRVHFHEVGAIDSIVDVIGVALALDSLEADKIVCSPVPLGSGTIHIDHGIYPVPAPATLEMMVGLPIAPCSYRLEMTTPTGAGIVAGVVNEFSASIPAMFVESVGYGAGTRDLPNQPNVLRVIVGRTVPYLEKWHVQHEMLQHTAHRQEQPHHHHHGDGHSHEHGHTHAHDHENDHGHSHEHDHGHEHDHSHNHGHHHAHDNGHEHSHSHEHGLEHGHEHNHSHEHGHEHDHSHDHKHAHPDRLHLKEHEDKGPGKNKHRHDHVHADGGHHDGHAEQHNHKH